MANSDSKIVYLNPENEGGICIITPTDNCINPDTGNLFTLEEIAKKDVPTGVKYKIVPITDIPTDRSFRDAWTVSESNLTDGVGA
tara:strand:+ start:7031 stop:7285 length:255 start_codon:yes stop_codon:yes gene_type:complete